MHDSFVSMILLLVVKTAEYQLLVKKISQLMALIDGRGLNKEVHNFIKEELGSAVLAIYLIIKGILPVVLY